MGLGSRGGSLKEIPRFPLPWEMVLMAMLFAKVGHAGGEPVGRESSCDHAESHGVQQTAGSVVHASTEVG
jgi:hypothetical protein